VFYILLPCAYQIIIIYQRHASTSFAAMRSYKLHGRPQTLTKGHFLPEKAQMNKWSSEVVKDLK